MLRLSIADHLIDLLVYPSYTWISVSMGRLAPALALAIYTEIQVWYMAVLLHTVTVEKRIADR